MPNRTETWGGLLTRIIEPPDKAAIQLNVVLSHGYGAPGQDLIPLEGAINKFERLLSDRVRYLFPEAPLDLREFGMPSARAWWPLDMWRLQEAVATGSYRELAEEIPDGLSVAREMMFQWLQACERDTGLPVSRTVIGGFSQGAMLSTDVALHLPIAPAGLLILSGSFITPSIWSERLQHRTGLPVFQSHGKYDPLLPAEFARLLRDAFEAAGNPVDYFEFDGGHEIPFDAMKLAAGFLKARIST